MSPFLKRRIPFLLILLIIAVTALLVRQRRMPSGPTITASGGEPFQNFTPLDTTFFLQTDPRWENDTIGGSGESLKNAGCTLSCLAMALHAHGIRQTPAELNALLKSNNGYTALGLIKWEAVPGLFKGAVRVDYSSPLSHQSIDTALRQRQPVLARIFLGTAQHWVLIVGKEGAEYLVRDPLGEGQSLERLSRFESPIYAIRIVKHS